MNKTILIVEDEFIVADDLQLTLQNAGYEITGIADNVETAREIIGRLKPSMVLLDIHLKGKVNGIQLAMELAEKAIAFVFISANSNQTILEQAKSTNPYGFLVKPFREKDLLVMLDIAFYKHENSNEVKWRKESAINKELHALENISASLPDKLMAAANALQQLIQFDMLAFKFILPVTSTYSSISFLRSGFHEYQTIGAKELSVITRLSENEIKLMMVNSSVERNPQFYNGRYFAQSALHNPMRQLLATHFFISSEFNYPLVMSNGKIASIAFFRRNEIGFSDEHRELLLRLQYPLISLIESLVNEAENQSAIPLNKNTITERGRVNNIIGSSAALYDALHLATQVAPVDTSVLLLGESGTGKEKIADAIHQMSPRKAKAFIKINCAALPPTLIESELFGHEKGAFTNAIDKRIGKFELANNGTIFLDEVGELPLDMQVKLLRVLQEKEIERVGGKEPIKLNVRVIAATNRNLQEEMANGKFRIDLYYRLNVFPITIAPLRERREDIKDLSEFFAAGYCQKFNKPYAGISDEMLAQLLRYDFPGNVRELENIIEQSVVLNVGNDPLKLKQPLRITEKAKISFGEVQTLDDFKRLQRQTETEYLSSVLQKTGGRIRGKNGAAELLNEKPTTLESRLLKLGIKKEDF